MNKFAATLILLAALGAGQPAFAAATDHCDQSADQGFKGTTVGPVQTLRYYLSVDGNTSGAYGRFAIYQGDPSNTPPSLVVAASANASGVKVSGRRAGTTAAGNTTNAEWNIRASQQEASACVADPDRKIGYEVP